MTDHVTSDGGAQSETAWPLPELVPARMLNEFVYCPRLAYLEWVQGEFIEVFERRLDELVTHPVFGYAISYRRVIEVQVRLLARFLTGEIPSYPAFRTR